MKTKLIEKVEEATVEKLQVDVTGVCQIKDTPKSRKSRECRRVELRTCFTPDRY